MSIATLIDKIAGRQRQREQARQADFRGIVVQDQLTEAHTEASRLWAEAST